MKSVDKSGRIIRYTLLDRFRIKTGNIFWYVIDNFSCKFEKVASLYEKYITDEYVKEGQRFNLSKSKSILHIGCGAYPITVVTLAELNGGKIVGLERNLKEAKKAKKIIKQKKLEDRIKIIEGDGTYLPIKEFDTIIVSGCSVPKITLLEHIFDNAKPNTKIIVRELISKSNIINRLIESSDNIEILEKIQSSPFPTSSWDSFYLIKKA